MDRAEVLESVCKALSETGADAAGAILDQSYAFAPPVVAARRSSFLEFTRVFLRDGFVDRYSGERLVFPPVVRLLSQALPRQLPYHPNWKTSETHPAYWQVVAMIDHREPVALEGVDEPENWITTSMAHNSAKTVFTLHELGWTLHAPGDLRQWDGLLRWSLEYWGKHPDVPRGALPWLRAGRIALAEVAGC